MGSLLPPPVPLLLLPDMAIGLLGWCGCCWEEAPPDTMLSYSPCAWTLGPGLLWLLSPEAVPPWTVPPCTVRSPYQAASLLNIRMPCVRGGMAAHQTRVVNVSA
jgi:hypothetical protein